MKASISPVGKLLLHVLAQEDNPLDVALRVQPNEPRHARREQMRRGLHAGHRNRLVLRSRTERTRLDPKSS